MNLHLTDEQTLLLESFSKLFEKESTPARIRGAEPLGFDFKLWGELVQAGAPALRVPESAEGAGLGLFEAVLIAEAAGRRLVCAPLVETVVAARLLALSGHPTASKWLAALLLEGKIVSLALAPLTAASQLVPAGAIADAVLGLLDGNLVLITRESGSKGPANLGSLPLDRLQRSDPAQHWEILLEGAPASRLWEAAREEWKLLTASMVIGAARQALDEAAAYARERFAFDRPIGSYQGLAHPLADSITDVDGAALLLWKAASASSGADGKADAAAISMAYWWSVRASAAAVVKAMRVFGGYGMAMEQDAQLYFRRIRSWSMLIGDPEDELNALGARLWDSHPTATPDAGDDSIDFAYGHSAEHFAAGARAFFRANLTDEMRAFAFLTDDGDHKFNQRLAQAGFLFADWPSQYGGSESRTAYDMAALRSVYAEFGWPKVLMTVTDMVGRIIMHFANEDVKAEILPKLASGASNCSLGYSEPSCGSDIFAAKTKAVRDGDDWIIDGQKMFTSQGHLADYCLLIARTDPALAKHAGITLFIVPLDLPGYEVQEVKTLGAERTNVTFYTAMRVPDRYRIGAVNGGAKVMGAALTMEQSGGDFFVSALQAMLKHAVNWAKTPSADGRRPIEDLRVRARLAMAQTRVTVADLLDRRCLWAGVEKRSQKFYGPMAKLFASEALVACSTDLMELTAPFSLLQGMTDLGAIELESRKAVQATIYGGTSEVQRSIIAETALGLPRTRS